jgi:endogenous inhibitor of DNA gyrase (YacG/DUF329 family)
MSMRTHGPASGSEARIVRCPGCGQPARFEPANRWRPFCSARCRGVDLGAWANEDYRVPEQARDADAAVDPPDAER